jgi:molybdopterin synthase catalytic subunit
MPQQHPTEAQEDGCFVALTFNHLDAQAIMDKVKDPGAGAIVLFAGKPPPIPYPLISALLH